jgi:predicted phosphodiesterase
VIVGICTDLHGHTRRFEQFVRQARGRGAEELWCLGDVVDSMIGAPPAALAESVDVVTAACDLVLGGNHELWCLQRGLLDAETARVVEGWSPVEERHGVGLVHGSLDDPFMEFVTTAPQAGKLLRATDGWLAVHGHTHKRRLWAATGTYPHAVARPTRGVVAAGEDKLLACPGALTGGRPTWLRVDLEARELEWVALA